MRYWELFNKGGHAPPFGMRSKFASLIPRGRALGALQISREFLRRYRYWVLFLAVSLFVFHVSSASGAVRGDFNGDASVDMNDIACWFAYYQLLQQSSSPSISAVITQAQLVRKSLPSSFATTLPSADSIDLDSDSSSFNMNDIALLFGWYQYSNQNPGNNDATAIKSMAQNVRKSLSTTLENFPGLDVGSSSLPISITGIQPD